MCRNHHPEKSQGQECQECQGQIPRSRMSGMPRSNAKVKSQGQISQGQIFQECVECQGQISQGQMGNHKKPKTLKEMSIL